MHMLGVKYIFGPCASGSLQPHIKPGDFVICDQFVDRTKGRADTFYDGPKTMHVSSALPYCPDLRKIVLESAKEQNIAYHENGTVVVIQGPRFSTKSESRWYSNQGWEVINMTQYPECYLAREMEICYVNISLITDYDAGIEGHPEIKPVTYDEVLKVFNDNNAKRRKLLFSAIPKIKKIRSIRKRIASKVTIKSCTNVRTNSTVAAGGSPASGHFKMAAGRYSSIDMF